MREKPWVAEARRLLAQEPRPAWRAVAAIVGVLDLDDLSTKIGQCLCAKGGGPILFNRKNSQPVQQAHFDSPYSCVDIVQMSVQNQVISGEAVE